MSEFYAYIHCRPDGTPFYVGKGRGRRAFKFGQRQAHHRNIVEKHGEENIVVYLIPCPTEEAAFKIEKSTIFQLRKVGYALINLTDGGEGAAGRKHRPESIALMRKVQTGKVITPEARERMAEAKRGKKLTPEHVAKILPRFHSVEARKKAAESNRGKKRTPEQVARMQAGKTKFLHTEESRAKMRAGWARRKASLEIQPEAMEVVNERE